MVNSRPRLSQCRRGRLLYNILIYCENLWLIPGFLQQTGPVERMKKIPGGHRTGGRN